MMFHKILNCALRRFVGVQELNLSGLLLLLSILPHGSNIHGKDIPFRLRYRAWIPRVENLIFFEYCKYNCFLVVLVYLSKYVFHIYPRAFISLMTKPNP